MTGKIFGTFSLDGTASYCRARDDTMLCNGRCLPVACLLCSSHRTLKLDITRFHFTPLDVPVPFSSFIDFGSRLVCERTVAKGWFAHAHRHVYRRNKKKKSELCTCGGWRWRQRCVREASSTSIHSRRMLKLVYFFYRTNTSDRQSAVYSSFTGENDHTKERTSHWIELIGHYEICSSPAPSSIVYSMRWYGHWVERPKIAPIYHFVHGHIHCAAFYLAGMWCECVHSAPTRWSLRIRRFHTIRCTQIGPRPVWILHFANTKKCRDCRRRLCQASK